MNYVIASAEERHAEAPDTFQIPDLEYRAEKDGMRDESIAAHRYVDGYIAALWWVIDRIEAQKSQEVKGPKDGKPQ